MVFVWFKQYSLDKPNTWYLLGKHLIIKVKTSQPISQKALQKNLTVLSIASIHKIYSAKTKLTGIKPLRKDKLP